MNNQGKKLVKAGIALSLLTSTLLHATNGDHLIGIGAKTRGMAGTGIALSQGAESALQNPALITSVKGTQISFGGTVFMPDVKFMGMQSDADMNVIPSVSLAHNLGNNWYIGTGMWGTAGMGVDYPLMGVSTTLQLMQFAVPVAYKGENYSFGIAPIMQYGSLDINAGALQTGQHQDFGFGFNLGMTYDITENFTFGAMYKSAISMTYDYTLSNFMSPTGDKLQQPAEYGVGLAYTTGEHTIALDAKKIEWSSADGYEYFGWEDQTVVAVGYEYNRDNYAFRLGYNHASSPIEATNYMLMNNLLLFPAIVESHIAVGGTYKFTDTFSLDLAYVHALENDDLAPVTHSQDGLSFQLTFDF